MNCYYTHSLFRLLFAIGVNDVQFSGTVDAYLRIRRAWTHKCRDARDGKERPCAASTWKRPVSQTPLANRISFIKSLWK